MKSFFVIKIKNGPDKWYDQQGNWVATKSLLPQITAPAEHAVGVDISIDDPNQVPIIKLWFHVVICENEDQVKTFAARQNSY